MAYNIYRADGTSVIVPDNTIDPQFYNSSANGAGKGQGTQLVGRNAIDYGAPTAQNFLQLTENFASNGVLPTDTTSSVGQLWFNKSTSALYVRSVAGTTGGINNWQKLLTLPPGETGRSPVVNPVGPSYDGDIRTGGTSLAATIEIYANGAWRKVFPAVYS